MLQARTAYLSPPFMCLTNAFVIKAKIEFVGYDVNRQVRRLNYRIRTVTKIYK